MAEQSYKAQRDLVVSGKPQAEGQTFTAEPETVRVALARGWVEQAKASAKASSKGKQGKG